MQLAITVHSTLSQRGQRTDNKRALESGGPTRGQHSVWPDAGQALGGGGGMLIPMGLVRATLPTVSYHTMKGLRAGKQTRALPCFRSSCTLARAHGHAQV